MPEKFLLKDQLFNKGKVDKIATEIHSAFPSFKRNIFVSDILAKFPELELKERISWIVACLKKYLPDEYRQAVGILINALPEANNPDLSDDDFGDFIYAPYAEFVAKNGCTKEHLQFSLDALHKMTRRFSAEDAIRYFINAFPEETLAELLRWTKDAHYHVRRLSSEGTRPKLPWSQKINIPVTAPLTILNNLFSDKTRFVTRSVANHINDISKIAPDIAIDTLTKWKKSGGQQPKEMNYIISHSLRTLLKEGNPKALKMLGFSYPPQVVISNFIVPEQVKMNTALEFSFTITAREDSQILIDYIIFFQNKSGEMNSRKVFKLTKLTLLKNKPQLVSKSHMLREKMTTRTLYPGMHKIEIQVNGKRLKDNLFLLK